MAKGAVAKQVVTNKIAEAFGADYIGEVDKKLYVWADENGEKVQIAIALTCPKVQVETGAAPTPVVENGGGYDWDAAPVGPSSTPAEITVDEQKNIADLMAQLGL